MVRSDRRAEAGSHVLDPGLPPGAPIQSPQKRKAPCGALVFVQEDRKIVVAGGGFEPPTFGL